MRHDRQVSRQRLRELIAIASIVGTILLSAVALGGAEAGAADAPAVNSPSVESPRVEHECPQCAEARRSNGWCDACRTGYVGGVRVPSEYLWHVLDAHGHRIELESLDASCLPAIESDGWCEKERIGFVDREAYFSRLAWLLARAEPVTEAAHCAVCSGRPGHHGWCDGCGYGTFGAYRLADREQFERLLHEMRILEIAIEAAARCEDCAAAIVTDSQCPVCRIDYRDGKPVVPPPAQ